jgi:hypothetical protein
MNSLARAVKPLKKLETLVTWIKKLSASVVKFQNATLLTDQTFT